MREPDLALGRGGEYETAAHQTSLRALYVNFGRVVRGAEDVFDAIDAEAAL